MYFEYSENEVNYLKRKDKKLAKAIEKIGFIKREIKPNLFVAIVHSIIGQQISTKAHKTLWKRFEEKVKNIDAKTLASFDLFDFDGIGIANRKLTYILDFAKKVYNKEFDIDALYSMSDNEAIKSLSSLKGIGQWTAEMAMIFSMQRKNILSYKDLAIIRAIKMLYGYKDVDKITFEKLEKRYSPFASIASLYLWEIASGKWDFSNDKNTKKQSLNSNHLYSKNDEKFAVYKFDFGYIKIAHEDEKIKLIKRVFDPLDFGTKTDLTNLVYFQLLDYFDGKKIEFNFPYFLKGTNFQKRVWNELLKIPYGKTKTYKEIAIAIGDPRASRAVGMANNKNPISIFVPCHRVVGSNGKLVGYATGVDMKEMLLKIEKKANEKL
ncbi:METHYLATED-DNA--PROTEIN-CYSTEINE METHYLTRANSFERASE (6-O-METHYLGUANINE-DNA METHYLTRANSFERASE) (O-6-METHYLGUANINE-DNA-ALKYLTRANSFERASE) [Mycoplasmopsis pulmonis]|uniref:Methylated-DNA--protein-cysteine methyltransferase n=1 Tax=Mycoplasmopsis pulmonis (strain UAB CTIP) TaxID=272635 RepID=Q98RB4_MYCPU|nr:methylated-DNA--[protein]-cysteine S-methyltransferase [Mycoplasmopsis pulmonis]MDZ7293067.1 methylated-DNA--[protein]-cysteine S-methyltransferase [Mycoplasmopsis pulmonis]CAC13268.1 METHYLATED-DNA--PROTEIN-CYSTEINE METHYLTRANSFERASE (6-O-METHYLGUANINE-DNA METHYLTRANSFERASE) (O-6-METHYLGUANINE-DNA-ALKYLTRANSFERASE) [Mycoplasmopsis pulmonis]VEU67860.1 Methylated-DNA--protein-cysteine methyltransferase, constitutive [Mycoplasmopsis pulmonis]